MGQDLLACCQAFPYQRNRLLASRLTLTAKALALAGDLLTREAEQCEALAPSQMGQGEQRVDVVPLNGVSGHALSTMDIDQFLSKAAHVCETAGLESTFVAVRFVMDVLEVEWLLLQSPADQAS